MLDMLLVGPDIESLRRLGQTFGSDQSRWRVRRVTTVEMAIEELGRRPPQVLLACLDEPLTVWTGLFDAAAKCCPGAVRLAMLDGEMATALPAMIPMAHQCMPARSDVESLQAVLAGAATVADRMRQRVQVQRLICNLREVASPPALYFDIRDQLHARDGTLGDTAAIAARDPALVARVLKVANSGFFGLPRSVNDLTAALAMIGSDALLALVLASQVFSGLPPPGMNLDRLWRHAQVVSELARSIVRAEGGNRAQQNSAAMAGLLHDIGLIVLFQNEASRYHPLWRRAAGDETQLAALERDEFGVSHDELGALILTLWTLPVEVVHAVEYSHGWDSADMPLVSRAVFAAEWLQGGRHADSDGAGLPIGSPIGMPIGLPAEVAAGVAAGVAAVAPTSWQRWRGIQAELAAAPSA